LKSLNLISLILLSGFATGVFGQPVFLNPSFEGTPTAGAAPPNWFICTGSPDIQPGFWGCTQTPTDGNTYLGFHHQESVSANFSNGLGACSQMSFNMDISIVPLNLPNNTYWNDNNQGVNDGYICIYGGYSSCDNTELLWQSPLITNVLNWQTFQIDLNPSQNYTYLNIVPCINGPGFYTYFGIDNIQVINQVPLVDPLTDQNYCEGDNITIDLTGGFSQNATFQWSGPNGFTSTNEDISIPNAMLTHSGQYTVVVTDNGCQSDPVSAQINIIDCTPNLQCNLLCNVDFEDQQVVPPGNFTLVNHSNVPCWSTTAADAQVEVWGTGFNGVPAYSGNQFIELNANLVSTIYQDFQVLPGSTVDISFAHRGRSGTDVMSVSVGPVGGPYTNLGTFSTGNTAWQYYTVNYTFPAIPQVDYSLRFNSISAAGGSQGVGNFLDAISITMPQLDVSHTFVDPTCTLSEDGSIDVTVNGGTPPFSISWDTPLTSTDFQVTNLGGGQYTYNIIDQVGCEYTDMVTLTPQFSEAASTTDAGICDGESYVLPSGLSVTQAGTYSDTLATVNGCDSVVTTNLTVNPVFNSTLNVSICDGDSHTLPSGTVVTTSGSYSETLQTTSGCDSTIVTELTVNPSPVNTVPVTICSGQTYLAEGVLQSTSGTYYDTFTTQFGCDSVIITDLTVQAIIVHTIDTMVCVGDSVLTAGYWKFVPGTYNDTLVTQAGCDSLVVTNLSNHPQPTADISVSNSCLDESLMISDASSVSGGSITNWQWQLGNGNTSNSQQPQPQTYPTSGTYTISLVVWSDQGCVDSTETDVEMYPLPIALFTFDSVCDGQAVQFTDLSTAVGPSALTQWSWIFDGGQTASIQNPQIQFSSAGLYGATLTVTSSAGCKADTTLGQAQVYPNPVANISTVQGHCLYDSIDLLNASTIDNQWGDNIVSWNWNLEPSITSSNQNPTHTFSSFGIQTIELEVESNNGCTNTTSTEVEVYARPEVSFSLSKYEGCEPLDMQYMDESDVTSPYAVTQWNWELGNGIGSTDSNPFAQHNYSGSDGITPDTLQVKLSVATGEGCLSVDTATSEIVVFPEAGAAYKATPTESDMVDPTITFTDMSTINVTERTWAFGDGLTSTVTNPVYTYPDTGIYEVGLMVSTDYGCTDATSGEILIYPHFSFFVPNTFTPNGNGRNDLFRGVGEGYTEYSMSVYNRWGQEIYHGKGESAGWDGTFLGNPVEVAVYVYRMDVTDWEGNDHVFRGRVQILR